MKGLRTFSDLWAILGLAMQWNFKTGKEIVELEVYKDRLTVTFWEDGRELEDRHGDESDVSSCSFSDDVQITACFYTIMSWLPDEFRPQS